MFLPVAVTLAIQTLVAFAIYSTPVMAPVATREIGVQAAAIGYFIAAAYVSSMSGAQPLAASARPPRQSASPAWLTRIGPKRATQPPAAAEPSMLPT